MNLILALKTRLTEEPDIEIVGEATDTVDVLLKTGNTHANVVAIDFPRYGKDSGLCSHLLTEYPELKVFALSEEGDRIILYETVMLRRQAFDTSLEKLADLIRWSVSSVDTDWDETDRFLG